MTIQELSSLAREWNARRRSGSGAERKALRRRLRKALIAALAWGLLHGVQPVAEARDVAFDTARAIDAGFEPQSVAAGDLDGDGDLDLAGTSLNDLAVGWWENDGTPDNGGWVGRLLRTGFAGTQVVELADLDRDGDLDVVAMSNLWDEMDWWENDGTPGDGGWTTHTIATGFTGATSVLAVDLDEDGDLDLLGTGTLTGGGVVWWQSDGTPQDGGWTARGVDTSFPTAIRAAAADVDRDGDLDVFVTSGYINALTWWENDGTPADGGWITHTLGDGFYGAFVVIPVDLDGDGDLDLLSDPTVNQTVVWWENDGTPGDGGWLVHTLDSASDRAQVTASLDLDMDGDLDVLGFAGADASFRWWENDGSPRDGGWSLHAGPARVAGGDAPSERLIAADLDRDGDPDVLGATASVTSLGWWRNETIHRDATFPAVFAHTIGSSFDGAFDVTGADLDGDGDLDVLGAAYFADAVGWWENSGGAWTPHSIDTAFDGPQNLGAVDLDRDGDLDVLGVAFAGHSIAWWENDGTPRDGGWSPHTLDAAFDGAFQAVAADLDGDGDLDVLGAAIFTGGLGWWESDGTPTDGGWSFHSIDTGFYGMQSTGAADLDGDGDLDAFGASTGGSFLLWWENDGTPADGGWTTHTIDSTVQGATGPSAVDLDGDGDLDLLAPALYSGEVLWWENDGTPQGGGWQTRNIADSLNGPIRVAAADMDGDGDLDALGVMNYGGTVAWWENDGTPAGGDGWAGHPVAGGFGGARDVEAADVDKDGDLDVLGAAFNVDRIGWWENHGGQFGLPTVDTAPAWLRQGQMSDVLEVTAEHRGRAGDDAVELTGFELLLEEAAGDPLGAAEANALIESLRVYLDDGSGVFDAGSDTLVATVGMLAPVAGVQPISFSDADPNVQVQFGPPRDYFVVAELTADAESHTPRQFRITHRTESTSTAEDAASDIPLSLSWAANVASGIVVAGAPPTPTPTATPTVTPTAPSTLTPLVSETPTSTATPSATPTPPVSSQVGVHPPAGFLAYLAFLLPVAWLRIWRPRRATDGRRA